MTEINVKEGELGWQNERKGDGFVKIDDTEAFLHRSTLDRFGLVRLLKGDRVTVSLTVNEDSGPVTRGSAGQPGTASHIGTSRW